jgi:hypothetical protein
MESQKRIHLVNELMDEAQLMMAALEKAMEGQRIKESVPAKQGTHHRGGQYSLEDEHKAWGNVLTTLTSIQQELARIEQYEYHRLSTTS